jgi:hypothetical protein
MIIPTPSEGEAAAIAEAVERFLAETAPSPAAAPEPGAWQRAAIREGVGARRALGSPWGEAGGWGARSAPRTDSG